MRRVVLDTNCLLASLSSRSENFRVWRALHEGAYTLCVSNEILAEYEEMIALKTNKTVAENVINALVDSDYVEFVDPQFHLRLIETDPDDNKFVDCALQPMPPLSYPTTNILTSLRICHSQKSVY